MEARHSRDIVESFLPTSRGQKYLLVVVDYFKKWAEAKVVRSIKEESIKQFIFWNIIRRFGIPLQIIIDNDTKFTGHEMREFCEENCIRQSFTLAYHSQTNGQVEVTKHTITTILKRKVRSTPRTWVNLILEVM